jgi:hypothetical protein
MSKRKPSEERKEQVREVSRRSLIKWTVASSVALGLRPWQAFEILESSGGVALAQSAACAPTNRSVHIIAGNGGFAWFQLLWPHNDIAAAGNPNFAFHAPGQQVMATGTDKPLTLGPQAPFKNLPGQRQMTAFMAGTNQTHTDQPTSNGEIAPGVSVYAAVAAMQATNPTLIPVIQVADVPFGNAQGAPGATVVPDPDSIVGIFNTAVSRAGGLLSQTQDAELYQATLRAMAALNASARTGAGTRAQNVGKSAASLMGTNLAAQLQVSNEDLARYGVSMASPTTLLNFAKTLAITAKAFSLGLSNSVIMPAFRDDPHGAFTDMNNLTMTAQTIGQSLQAFYDDLARLDDPSCSGKLDSNLVLSIHGDTPKDPRDRNGWPDGTPQNSNWVYVLGNGHLKTGWFGGIDRNGGVQGFNPTTGAVANTTSQQNSAPAAAAIAYAVTKGDMRRVRDYYNGVDIAGIIRASLM